jgi:hypothetical protein
MTEKVTTFRMSCDPCSILSIVGLTRLDERFDAGDKFVVAQDGWEDRKVAERAVERICNIAPVGSVANFWLGRGRSRGFATPEVKQVGV